MLRQSNLKLVTLIVLYSIITFSPQANGDLTATTIKCSSILSVLSGKQKPILYRVSLDISPSEILTEPLAMVKSKGFVENLKSVARNKKVAAFLLKNLEGQNVESRELNQNSLASLLKENSKYTFILTNDGLHFIELSNSPAGFFLTKHNVLSQLDPVRFAGEFWLDNVGRLHISNSSGSYQPPKELLPKIEEVFRRNFDLNVVLDPHGEKP